MAALLALAAVFGAAAGLEVVAPASIAGLYPGLAAQFGDLLPAAENAIEAALVEAVPANACTALENAADVAGTVALVERGACAFATKATHAAAAGALAVVVINVSGDEVVSMTGDLATDFGVSLMSVASSTGAILQAATEPVTVRYFQAAANVVHTAALVEFFEATGGSGSWTFIDGAAPWTAAPDPCLDRWYQVGCDCDTGDVVELRLRSLGLEGILSDSLGDIETMRAFVVSSNMLESTVPSSLASWTGLTIFDASNTRLFGSLAIFDALPNLVELDLSGCDFTGALPTNWPSTLEFLSLQDCALSSTIPESLGSRSPGIVTLRLARNGFWGTLPATVSLMEQLEELSVESNFLSGTIPPLPSGLSTLGIANNQFESLGDSIANLTLLQSLDFSFNLIDTVPDLSRTAIESLDGRDNLLTELPDDVLPTTLLQVDLSRNFLEHLGTGLVLSDGLQVLNLDSNLISDHWVFLALQIPGPETGSGEARGPSTLSVASNLLETTNGVFLVGDFARLFPNAVSVDFSDNLIEGQFLQDLREAPMQFLQTLDFSSNNGLSGTLPPQLVTFPSLKSLTLTKTNLHYDGDLRALFELLTPDYDVTEAVSDAVHCPAYFDAATFSVSIAIDHSYHDFELCWCAVNHYRNADGECAACPSRNAFCPGEFEENTVVVFAGHYPLPGPDDVQAVVECPGGTQVCNSNETALFECAEGHLDRLCSKCADGYFRRGDVCLECSESPLFPALFVVAAVIALPVVWFLVTQRPVDRSKLAPTQSDDDWSFVYRSLSGIFFIGANHLQMVSIVLGSFSLPGALSTFQGSAASVDLDASGIGLECFGALRSPLNQYRATVVFPLILLGAILVFYGCVGAVRTLRLRRRGAMAHPPLDRQNAEPSLWNAIPHSPLVYSVLFLLNLLYFPLASANLVVLRQCTTDPTTGIEYFAAWPYLRCQELELYEKLLPLFFYTIGIPAVFAAIMWRYRDDRENVMVVQHLSFFVLIFRKRAYWGALAVMARRLALGMVIGLSSLQAAHVPVLIVSILFVNAVYTSSRRPYVSVLLNRAEVLSLGSVAILYLCGLVLHFDNAFNTDSGVIQAVIFLVTAFDIVFFVAVALLFYNRVVRAKVGPIETGVNGGPGGVAALAPVIPVSVLMAARWIAGVTDEANDGVDSAVTSRGDPKNDMIVPLDEYPQEGPANEANEASDASDASDANDANEDEPSAGPPAGVALQIEEIQTPKRGSEGRGENAVA